MLHDVGSVDDFEEGRIRILKVGRWEIGVLRWGGRFFAVRNHCPHLGGPLCAGEATPVLDAGPDPAMPLEVDADRVVIVCPWHRWEFDPTTGGSIAGRLLAKTYRVVVDGTRVMLDAPARRDTTTRIRDEESSHAG
jgi:nitrite reductase/ring-hydroxylating ferredoxin subunit